MDNTTLGRLFAGLLLDLIEKLSGEQGEEWYEALRKFLRKENPWIETQKTVMALLRQVKTVELPAIGTFKPANHFKITPERERKTAEVPVGWMNDDAKCLVKGLIEPETPEATLTIYRLLEASKDDPIIAQLRGDHEVQAILTTWSQMYEMMKAQAHGEEGNLLVNGHANIYYIPQADGTIWAVCCSWRAHYRCWYVLACPVTCTNAWHAGDQVISR